MIRDVDFINFPDWADHLAVKAWLLSEMDLLNLSLEVVYSFMSDEELLKLNKEHLDHDTYTDIITYDFRSEGLEEANLCISYERVVANALTFEVSNTDELCRVCVHGLLHLAGHDDKDEISKSEMRNQEQLALNRFHVEH
ncbi:MAG: rRNA maturation RNase YbeY [Flavobacteriaceae bacterium]|nr:rRNA maturation RNase YbeY [Flavobacteriaceae bacterium]